jgi:hypothetical protein
MSTLLFFSRPRQLHGVHICARVLSHQAARLSFPSTAAVNPTVNFMSTPFPVLRPRSLHRLCAHARLFSCPTGVLRQTTAVGTTDDSNSEDFFRYTSGRWLWDEAARLEERYKQFNIAELKQAAVEVTGAQSCSQMTKLAEGGFNKVFKLVMDNNSIVIARIPNPNVGRADRVIASEVATMEFVRSHDWSCDETMLTRTRQRKSSASLFQRSCLGAETNRML